MLPMNRLTESQKSVIQARKNAVRHNEDDRLIALHKPCRYCGTDLSYRSVDEIRAGVCLNCASQVAMRDSLNIDYPK